MWVYTLTLHIPLMCVDMVTLHIPLTWVKMLTLHYPLEVDHSLTRRWPEKTCFRMLGRAISDYVVSYTIGTDMLQHVNMLTLHISLTWVNMLTFAHSVWVNAESAHSSGHSFTRRWPEKTCFRMRGRTISEYVVSYTLGTYMLRHVWNVWGIPSIFDHYCSWRKGYKKITMSHQGDPWWQGRDLHPGQSDWPSINLEFTLTRLYLTLTWPWLDLDLTLTWPWHWPWLCHTVTSQRR